MNRWLRLGLVGGGVAVAVALIGGIWLARQINPPGPAGPEVRVAIQPGTSVAGIARRLETDGVLTSARIFRAYLRVRASGTSFHAGEYELRRNMSMGATLAALRRGPQIAYERLTIPEGFTLEQIAERVGELPGHDRDRFLELARSGQIRSKVQPEHIHTLEGVLFPDTYQVTDQEDEEAVLRRLVARFDRVVEDVGITSAALPAGLSPYEAVVAASLVETEAKVDEDRPLIASVIRNRLERGMRLQIDATVLYALGEHKSRVLYRDLEVDSPYNTYRVDGLPPTPIGASGRASLEAVLAPPETDYIFYVLYEPSGKHAFAATAAEFERLKAESRRKGLR